MKPGCRLALPTECTITWQLSLNWHADRDRLLPGDWDHSFAFRDRGWFQVAVREVLEENGNSLVIYSFPDQVSPQWVTADPVYLRFHSIREKYRGTYGRQGLEPWAKRIRMAGGRVYGLRLLRRPGHALQDAGLLRNLPGRDE